MDSIQQIFISRQFAAKLWSCFAATIGIEYGCKITASPSATLVVSKDQQCSLQDASIGHPYFHMLELIEEQVRMKIWV